MILIVLLVVCALLSACDKPEPEPVEMAAMRAAIMTPAKLDSARVWAWDDSYGNRLDVWAQADPGLITVTQAGVVLDENDAGNPIGGGVWRYWLNLIPSMDAPITIASATDTICWGWEGAPCLPNFAMVDSFWLDISAISSFANALGDSTKIQQVSPATGIKVAVDSGNLIMFVPHTAPLGWKTNYQDLLWQTVLWRERWNQ